MFGKRGVIQTDATKRNSETSFRDPGAMSGLLTGVSFIGGVGGAVALADSPYPRPGSEPAEVRQGAGRVVHPGRAVLRAAGERNRGCAARPPLGLQSAKRSPGPKLGSRHCRHT
jgi:hypothetical protein